MTDSQLHVRTFVPPGQPIVQEKLPDNCVLVIFGASGDLTERKLIPSLYHLALQDKLPKQFALIGYARSIGSDDEFRASLRASLEKHSRSEAIDESVWERLAARIFAQTGAYDSEEDFHALDRRIEEVNGAEECSGNRLFYLSTPASTFGPVIALLRQSGLVRECGGESWSRVIIEKPFGRDLATARELQVAVAAALDESQAYRIDHFLGKETVQNILVMRFGNTIFEPLWNRKHVAFVEITAAETIGIGSRGGFYEQTGVLRDMVQNHLIQIMALCAMEQPVHFGADEIRDEKHKLLRSVRLLTAQDVVLGQYAGYRGEKDVAADSRTPTYATLKLHVDNWRWQGVPFYLRTGKSLASRVTEIAVHFHEIPTCLFGGDEVCQRVEHNVLVLRIGPKEGVSLRMAAKVPGDGLSVGTVTMDFTYEEAFNRQSGEAYERLLLDAMRGDQTLFARQDEVLQAWQLLDPVLKVHEQGSLKVEEYKAGSQGPKAADQLLARDQHRWSKLE